MHPGTRVFPRLFSDTITLSPAKQCLRRAKQPATRLPICQKCNFHAQRRRSIESPKSPLPNSDASNISESTNPQPHSPAYPDDVAPSNLPSAEQSRRLQITRRFSHIMDHLQGNIFVASQRINDLTGYSGIEALKARIAVLEARVSSAQDAVRTARIQYQTSVAERAATQREVTTLLARKDSWSPSDLERFTALYRMDHTNEAAVVDAGQQLAEAEREAESAGGKLSSSILSRYHEEQIWSDKIRRMSTWGTWGLMGVNVLLFLVFQFGFEPWRRRRLVSGFEEKVREALAMEKASRGVSTGKDDVRLDGVIEAGLQELEVEMSETKEGEQPAVEALVACIDGQQEQEEKADLDTAELHVPTALMQLKNRLTWTAAIEDMFSDRRVEMKKQDVTIIALEGIATGAAIVTIIATMLLRRS